MWSRAVWREGKRVVEGVLSSNWIQDGSVRWPRRDAQTMANKHIPPQAGWLTFHLIKIKYSAGMCCLVLVCFQLVQ